MVSFILMKTVLWNTSDRPPNSMADRPVNSGSRASLRCMARPNNSPAAEPATRPQVAVIRLRETR